MEDKSIFTKNQLKDISEGLQNFIDSMMEEIVLEGKPFDTQKKYLRKFSEKEGVDYDKLEADISTFIEILGSLKTAFSNLQVKIAEEKGKECYISGDMVEKLIKYSSQQNKQTNNNKKILYALLVIAAIGIICFLLANLPKESAPYVKGEATEMEDLNGDKIDSIAVIEENSEPVLKVDTIDWKKLAHKYINIIKTQKNRGHQRCEYFMFDITQNNYPDLFLIVGDCEADYTMHVFSNYTDDYGNEKVREIFKFGAGHSSFYKGSNYIIVDCGTQGYYERHQLYYEDGEMCNAVIRHFNDSDWDSPQEPPITWISPNDYQLIYNANN